MNSVQSHQTIPPSSVFPSSTSSEYICVMFPYPSGQGLHVGHCYNYMIADSICRWKRYQGTDVFQPFGYDAFGLPAENYARQIGADPKDVTHSNIERFRVQMERMNTQFEERLVTCDPEYIKWTQYVFNVLKDRGLAYKAWRDVNWCSSCETVLANEQAATGSCERCGTQVEQRNLNQWFFKITDYKERLIQNLDTIDYPQSTIRQQRVWLENLSDWCVSRQRSWGCPIPVEGETDTLDTFVDSSFYYIRYCTNNPNEFIPKEEYKQVDTYIGGSEHACMHLIYARFIHMVLFDAGIVPVEEPFKKVIHQGMITKDGAKMSKSKGNVINPDDYDADELRMYLMFMGPYNEGGDWSDSHIVGIRRFITRMKTWLEQSAPDGVSISPNIDQLETTIGMHFSKLKVNKVISSWMEFYNTNKSKHISYEDAHRIEQLMQVCAPSFKANIFNIINCKRVSV